MKDNEKLLLGAAIVLGGLYLMKQKPATVAAPTSRAVQLQPGISSSNPEIQPVGGEVVQPLDDASPYFASMAVRATPIQIPSPNQVGQNIFAPDNPPIDPWIASGSWF